VTHNRTDTAGLKWALPAADEPSPPEIPEYRTNTEATTIVGKRTIQPSPQDNAGTGVGEPMQEPLPPQVTDEQDLVVREENQAPDVASKRDAPIKWAEDLLDTELLQNTTVTPTEGLLINDNNWPKLPPT
jgi:hypothetical protein